MFRFAALLGFILTCMTGLAQTPILDSLSKIIATGKKDEAHLKAIIAAAFELVRIDAAKAKVVLYDGVSLAKTLGIEKSLSGCYSQLASIHHNNGQIDSAQHYLQLLKHMATTSVSADKIGVQANYYAAAGLYYKKAGDIRTAITFFEQSLSLAETLGNKVAIAGQALNLGNVYMNAGKYKQALQYHLKALRYFEETNNEKGISFCYQSIGNSFIELKQYNEGLDYIQKSLQLKQALKDKRGLGTAYLSLGQIYSAQKNYNKALAQFNHALQIAEEFDLVKERGTVKQNIGKLYVIKGDSLTAMRYLTEAQSIARQLKDSSAAASIEVDMLTLRSKSSSGTEEKNLAANLQTLESSGNMPQRALGYKSMARYYAANNDFEKALLYTQKFHAANDSLINNELSLQLRKMEEQYTVEKKEKEIALLKKDGLLNRQKLAQQRYLIISAFVLAVLAFGAIWLLVTRYRLQQRMKELQLRNQIAADLHDEVGSSLSSIHLLSRMAAQQVGTTQSADIIKKVSDNAQETMEKMSDIVWMIKPGEHEAKMLVQRMERYLYEICTAQNIECLLEASELEELKLNMHQRKNFYLIFKEAVNNAVKYSNTKKLEVAIKAEGPALLMLIRDFGIGFNETIVVNGNGLQNMKMRAKDLKGELKIYSSKENGTELRLHFPV
jgi:two-component system, NarL family, sensor histidine kinase UhpB